MELNLRKQGFITAVHRERYEVSSEGEHLYAKLKPGIYYAEENEQEFPTIGDNVILEYNIHGDSLIVETLQRKTKFSRRDPDVKRGEQVIAVNIDYVFIMMSLDQNFNRKRLDRYLTVSLQSGAVPVVVLTKADLADDMDEKVKLVKEIAGDIEVIPISSVTGTGIENLKKYLQPEKTICFLGSSGVGKSTFTNLLLGEERMRTNVVREADSRGHHTTTHRQMFLLDNGARIIDTPGMRELGMWIAEDGVELNFAEIEELIKLCKFSNCTHTKEPNCAIRKALKSGKLSEERWGNYRKISRESKLQVKKAARKDNKSKEKYTTKDRIKYKPWSDYEE